MFNRPSAPVLTAIMLALVAGSAAPVFAQSREFSAHGPTAVASTVDFRSSKWLSNRTVVNNNDEKIASVSELILDRGSGKIEYIVINTGETMGMGGRAVAIPYASFRTETSGSERFVLAATAEQLKQFPEYTPESWKAMKDAAKDDKNALHTRLAAESAAASDPYAGNLDTAKAMRIEGKITKVERIRTSTFGEHVVITVEPATGAAKRVALGPSWFVNGSAAAPMRGDQVVVDTLALPRDPDQLLAATEIRSGDRELRLRETDGSATWALRTVETNKKNYNTPYSRYLLLSSLSDMKIDCRGEDCGKVNDIILDRNSGEIGFVSIDPNENFLGIADTKRLIPWSVATVAIDGTMRIDASKEMVLASPETPADLAALNSGTRAEGVYRAFDVPAPRFEAPKPVPAAMHDAENAWSAHGPIISAIERDSAKSIAGKVIEITEVKFDGATQPAKALKVRLPGDTSGEEVVLIGPAWYMANQKDSCKAGDTITISAIRTTIDGRKYWIARSIDCKDSRVVLLDSNNTPVWSHP